MPFPFYNTAAPTSTSKNTINSVTVDYGIRDFLLNCNLGPVYPQIATNINGSPHIGEPVLDTSINGNTNVTPNGLPLETWGLYRYNIAVLPNQFQNNNQNAPELISVDNITQTQGVFGAVDFPQGSEYPTAPTTEVGQYGILGKSEYAEFRKNATRFNLYLDASKQTDMSDYISLQPIQYNEQITGYLDEFGHLNQGGGPQVQTANVIGSLLNGQGIGLAKGGIVPNFDVRASLAGRVLGATGTLRDSRLGQIGGQQLALSLANNAAFNVEQDILGSLNTQDNILALVKGGPLPGFRPNYKITVPIGGGAKAFDYAASILGFTLPKSYLSPDGSIFLSESDSANIERANAMILNTGKGQVESLIRNMFANINGTTAYDSPINSRLRSGYTPGYKNNKGEKAIDPNIYAFGDADGFVFNFISSGQKELIPEISYNRANMIKKYGFESPEDLLFVGHTGNRGYENRKISNVGFSWGSYNNDGTVNNNAEYAPVTGNKKSLLVKTQELFNSKNMLNIVTAKGDMNKISSQIETANGGGFSKGSAVIKGDRYTVNGYYDGEKKDADNTYCRSWTTLDRYDKVKKLVRHRGLDETYPYRHQMHNSVLEDNGFVKIAPYGSDTYNESDIKRYMFSLENLAWSGKDYKNLIPCEQGPGDLLTGKKGRIMWFPPYNLQFNESSSVNWEKTDFIGRGESVYTYNNTERTGNLSFQLIVDHPSYMNKFAGESGPDDNYIASYIAGCLEPNQHFLERLTPSELNLIRTNNIKSPHKITAPVETPPTGFKVYFPNDIPDINVAISKGYENGLKNTPSEVGTERIDYTIQGQELGENFGIGPLQGTVTPPVGKDNVPKSEYTVYTDTNNYGLNGWKQPLKVGEVSYDGWLDPNYFPALKKYLETTCKHCKVKIASTASVHGREPYNTELAKGRTKSTYDYIKTNLGIDEKRIILSTTSIPLGPDTGCKPKDVPGGGGVSQKQCKEDRHSFVDFYFDAEWATTEYSPTPEEEREAFRSISNRIINRFYSECSFFEKLTQEDSFVFDSFREKIKYFHPAFHSTTPEGFNSRLTFLQQCTRQGSTLEGMGANNLAFGTPPICILRIGDFFNTKIAIDNINIDYEPLVWDLNPEGVGVQPMIANVNISFKFIGGSTLMSAINKLQNALSFNYYANTHVYDARADYVSVQKPTIKVFKEDGSVTTKEVQDNPNGYYINNTVNDLYNRDANFFMGLIESPSNVPSTTNQIKSNDDANGPISTPSALEAPSSASTANEIDSFVVLYSNMTTDGFLSVGVSHNTQNQYEISFKLKSNDAKYAKVYSYTSIDKIPAGSDTWSTVPNPTIWNPSIDLTTLNKYTILEVILTQVGNNKNTRTIKSNVTLQ